MECRVLVRSFAAIAALTMLVSAASAGATNSCKTEAKQNFKDCKANAKETFQASKDACFNRDHDCVEACRSDRYDCRKATGFDDAIDACDDTLEAAKAQCRADHPAGSEELDSCIDQHQVIAFQCRDQARETAKPALKQCRAAFVACAQACPPPPNGTPPVDPAQCRIDAKNQYKTDKAQCIEDYQIAKDACRHKDHACVEQCRFDRDGCRQPVDDQLASDIAQCDATRGDQNSGAIGNCYASYGPQGSNPDPTLLDQCIDNAQVAAFECRDQARENAQPGYANCRNLFTQCVQQCPAA